MLGNEKDEPLNPIEISLFFFDRQETKEETKKQRKNLQRFSGGIPFSGSSSILHRRNSLSREEKKRGLHSFFFPLSSLSF